MILPLQLMLRLHIPGGSVSCFSLCKGIPVPFSWFLANQGLVFQDKLLTGRWEVASLSMWLNRMVLG